MSSTLRALIRLGRLPFVLGGVLLFAYGVLAAGRAGASPAPAELLLGCLVLAAGQLSVSYSNDYYDRRADALGERTRISGGSGVLVDRPDLARAARRIALGLIALSLLLAICFALLFEVSRYFLPFVLAGNLMGWYYTAPPFSLAYRGLGEAATMLTFGFFMPGMGYLAAAGRFDFFFFAVSLPLLFLGLAFILTVELPDMEADRAAGKKNFVVAYGRAVAYRVIFSACAVASVLFFLAALVRPVFGTIAFISLVPLAVAAVHLRASPPDRDGAVPAAETTMAGLVICILLADLTLLLSSA